MKRTITLLAAICGYIASFSQVITPFSIRHQTTQKGGIRYLSNSSVTCSGTGCAASLAETPPSGSSADNDYSAVYADMDGDASTFMSSSDSLSLPSCSEITWAGLYWGGENASGGSNYSVRNQCKIKVNGGSYINLTADASQDNAVGFTTYHCFKDITGIVSAAGSNARFTVANIAARIGGTNRFGGWTIVVVYKNDLQPTRRLTVFNGLSNVSTTNATTNITLSGFLTPLSGPVTFEIGAVTYDGDRGSVGDQLLFNGAGSYVSVSNTVNPTNDVFNSTMSNNNVIKDAPFVIPAYKNTLGYDADIFAPNNSSKNYIGNSATSATIRLTTATSGGETYLTQVVTMAIDVYEPDLRSTVRVEDLNGGAVQPGDILEYTITGKNIGSDPSVNTFLTDTLERNVTYVPGSLSVTYGPNIGAKTDAAGDDQAEYIAASRVVKVRIGTGANGTTGGTTLNSPAGVDSTQFKFRVTTTSDCIVLQCDNVVDNRSYIYGTGNVSGNIITNESNPGGIDVNGCPVGGTTTSTIVSTACTSPVASNSGPVCAGSTVNLSVTSSPSASYAWTGPNGFTSTLQNPAVTDFSSAKAGVYTVNITIAGTSCTFSPTTTVALAPPSSTGQVAGVAGGGVFTQSRDVTIASGNYYDAGCNDIARTQPGGASPVSGSVTSSVWVETAVPVFAGLPYVARHYNISPATNPTTATGTVTLYFLQAEFDAYNAVAGALPKLPVNSADATGIANIRIGQYAGTSAGNTGLAGSYSAGAKIVNPTDGNIVWNATAGRWEITFPVTGFGGFILQTSPFVLPVTLSSFTAEKQGSAVLLQWQTTSELNSSYFEIEYSSNGTTFTSIASVAAADSSNTVLHYSWLHQQPVEGTNYYRLRQVDLDGRFVYSSIVPVQVSSTTEQFRILVNPVRSGRLQVSFAKAATAYVCNVSGQVIRQQKLNAGQHTIDIHNLLPGVYLLKAGNETKKFIVE